MKFTKVPDYPDYEISRCGVVRSNRTAKSKEMKGGINGGGYRTFCLRDGNSQRTHYLHQMLAVAFLGHKMGGYNIVVDHINSDKTDNRLENLQLITNRENTSKDRKGGSSKFVGVTWDKHAGKWKSQVKVNGKSKHLGLFECEINASTAYNTALNSINKQINK